MNLKKATISIILVVIIIAAVITVIPSASATKVNRLGYKSICSFVPFSTITLLAIALIAFLIAKQFVWR